jgi:hypothetical protein
MPALKNQRHPQRTDRVDNSDQFIAADPDGAIANFRD